MAKAMFIGFFVSATVRTDETPGFFI